MKIVNRLADRFAKIQPLPVGVYHKQDVQDEKPYRIHLRLRPDGSGVLIVNAATILHLNSTAAEYAYHFIRGTNPNEVAKQIAARYRVSKGMALEDFQDFADKIETLISTPDLDPVSYLDFERVAPHSASLTAPLRLDCALTYRLPPNAHADYAPAKRVERELTTEEWQTVLDKAWQAGIPHVIFTGGEPTLRDDLSALIAYAEKVGQVCGLITDGFKLAEKNYLETLLQTGLDHVMLILQPGEKTAWKAIETIVPADLFLTVHLTLTKDNVSESVQILERLAGLGVQNLSLSTSDHNLLDELLQLQGKASELNFTLRWDLPVPYSESNPVAMETEDDKIPSGAGKAWLYIEPDGDVLPTQGAAKNVLGNILRNPWEEIYK
ncbi:MAG: radical SAM protein [Chloroflexi bacterium]|nr:radical SAM protein [Chloroflexota bacterium]